MDEVQLYQQMMSKDPASQIFVYLAEALLEREMYHEAIETCVNGLRFRPHDLRGRAILGLAYLCIGEFERAESELLKAKEMLEINTIIYQALAEVYETRGEFELAENYRHLFAAILSPETTDFVFDAEGTNEAEPPTPEKVNVEAGLVQPQKRVDGLQAERYLLSALESWHKDVQQKRAQATTSEVSVSSGIDPGKLATFVHTYIKRSRASGY
jgi:tetratricopeptide (TPR) repeat protein